MSIAAIRRLARAMVAGALTAMLACAFISTPIHAAPPCGIWTQTASGTPPVGAGSSAIYDPIRMRVVMFNGGGSLWQHTTSAGWSTLAATGTPPPTGGQAFYDPVGDRMIALLENSSVWTLSLGGTPAWTSVATTGTSTPGNATPCVYDSQRNRLVMVAQGHTWALDISVTPMVWSIVVTNPPSFFSDNSLVYDSNRDRLVLFRNPYPELGTLWELPLAGTRAWNGLALVGSPTGSREQERAVYDSIRDRMIMVGGYADPYHAPGENETWAIVFRDQNYFLDMTGTVRSHGAHFDQVLVFDPVDDELFMFGGWDGTYFGNELDDTWRLPFGNRAETFVSPTGGGTVTRSSNQPCDSLRVVTFTATPTPFYYLFSHWSGDVSGTTNPISVVMNSDKVVIANFIPLSIGPMGINLAWDDCGTAGLELKSFACNENSGPPFDLVASFKPPPGIGRFIGTAAYMSVVSANPQRLLPDWWKYQSGGCRGSSGITSEFNFPGYTSCTYLGDAVGGYLPLVAWNGDPQKLTILVQEVLNGNAEAALDPDIEYYAFKLRFQRSKAIGPGSCVGCTWPVKLTLDSVGVYQPEVVGFNPTISTALTRKQVRWQGGTPLSVDPRPNLVLALVGTQWDRGGRGGTVAFTIPESGETTLELLDVSGRKWASRTVADRSPGRHEVRLEAPRPLPSGVYFIRLAQRDASTSTKLVFAR